ncbi:MAG: transposase, partial [Nanoarchaeota archaeon]
VKICHDAQIPIYIEKHDPKVFTTVQKIFLSLYKIKKKLTLRSLVEDLRTSKVVQFLNLHRIPNFSTLSYFLTTLPSRILSAFDDAVQKVLPNFEGVIVDSTGFECTYPSHYYCMRRNSAYPVDGFITLHAVIDQENGFIRAHKTRAKKVHDSKMLIPLIKKLIKKPEILYADRGYDSEKNYAYLVEKVDCVPLILQKNMLKPLEKCKGEYRRALREIFDYGEYLKRNKIEGTFSALKRKYCSTLSTRKVATQEKELTLKIIIYNLEKKIKMTLFIVIFRLNTFQQDRNDHFYNLSSGF